MGEFRDRMERDLQIRGFSPSTQQCYLARMKAMVRFFMRSPDELTLEDINAYQQHLTRDRKVGWGTFNQSVGAIRFFYGVTLEKDWDIQRIPYQKTGRKLLPTSTDSAWWCASSKVRDGRIATSCSRTSCGSSFASTG